MRPTSGATVSSSPLSACVYVQIVVQESLEVVEMCRMAVTASIVAGHASVLDVAVATIRSGHFASVRLLQTATNGIAIASRRIAIAPVRVAAATGLFGVNPIGLSRRRTEGRPSPMVYAIVGLAASLGLRQVARLGDSRVPVVAATSPSDVGESVTNHVLALPALPGPRVSVSSPIVATMLDAFVLRPVVGIAD